MTFQVVEDALQDIFFPELFQVATDHQYASQTGRDSPPQPNLDCIGELDGVLHDHGALNYGAPQDGRIQCRRACPPDGGEEGRDTTDTFRGGGDLPWRGLVRRIESGCTTAGADSAGRGVAVGDPSTVNGTELGVQDWRESLFPYYGIEPPGLPSHCDGFGAAFTICQALDFKKGGLITANHNEIHYGVADLVGKAFTSAHARDNPKIFTYRAMQGRGDLGKIISKGQGGIAEGGGIGEGGPADLGSLDSGDGQNSQYACCEY